MCWQEAQEQWGLGGGGGSFKRQRGHTALWRLLMGHQDRLK